MSSSQTHHCLPEFLSQEKRLSGFRSLWEPGGHVWWPSERFKAAGMDLLASCDPYGRQWRMAGCRQAPAMVLSSLEDPVLLSLVSFVSLSSVSSLLIFFAMSYLVQSDPERVGNGVLVHSLCPGSLCSPLQRRHPLVAPRGTAESQS